MGFEGIIRFLKCAQDGLVVDEQSCLGACLAGGDAGAYAPRIEQIPADDGAEKARLHASVAHRIEAARDEPDGTPYLDLGIQASRLHPDAGGRGSQVALGRRNIGAPREEPGRIAHGNRPHRQRITCGRGGGKAERLRHFAKQDGQRVDRGRAAALQFGRGHLHRAQQGLGTEPVEFAGRACAHHALNERQAVALALGDAGNDSNFSFDAAQLEPGGRHRGGHARLHAAQQGLA